MKTYGIADQLSGECSTDQRFAAIRANARIRRVVQDFGLDPLYASYLMHFVHTALSDFAAARQFDLSTDDLMAFTGQAIRHALRHFDELPRSCLAVEMSTTHTAETSSILFTVEKEVPHPPFMSNPVSVVSSATEITPVWRSIENRPALRPDWDEQALHKPAWPKLSCEAPPPVYSDQFNEALEEVRRFNESPTEQSSKIALFWNDSIGSTTPVGRWNAILSAILLDESVNLQHSLELFRQLNRVLYGSGIFCWKYKFQFNYPRPIQFFKSKKTIVKTPNFPSYPSGHSCFSAAASCLVGSQFPHLQAHLYQLAREASESRVMGGIHFRFDCVGGFVLGESIYKRLV